MLTEEAVVEIKVLARRGMSVRAIGRELRISRNTVRKYLRGEAVRPPGPGAGRPSKLGPYEHWLRTRVERARPIRIPATVLWREIRAMGFDGSERTVRRFVARLTPKPPPEPVVRFETRPGHQAQMDWGTYRLGGRRIYAFVGVLGFSRFMYIEYVDSMAAPVLVSCHQRMLAHFGGVPTEILYDNMKTVVTHRDAYGRGRHRFHDEIWDLAKGHGFRPRLCQPYRPQTKGKVERAVDYVANSFFHPLVTRLALDGVVPDLARLNAEALLWLAEIANVRTHGTTGERPIDRLLQDQSAMTPYTGTHQPPEAIQWPRYPIQRSPREYDAVLREVAP